MSRWIISKLCFTILTVSSFLPKRQNQEIATYFFDELLTIVSAVHHQRVAKTLNNRTLSLTEAFGGIPVRRTILISSEWTSKMPFLEI